MNKSIPSKIAIIGGGAAGFFCAINAAKLAVDLGLPVEVVILEASNSYLKKVRISGGGRCNVTHNCFDVQTFCRNYPRGTRELISPMQKFQAKDTVEWFRNAGVNLVAEADGRMFPDTNSSETIINCYLELVDKYKIKLQPKSVVTEINRVSDKEIQLQIRDRETLTVSAALIATGSSPGGYTLAESIGHSISERAPSLFSFKIKDPLLTELSGLSFSESSLKLSIAGKKTFKQTGPTLITHWGLSGPAILKLSAWAAREMKRANYQASLTVNWIGLDRLDDVQEILKEIRDKNTKSFVKNTYPTQLPKRFWLNLLEKCKVPLEKQWGGISKKELNTIAENLFGCQLTILGQNRFKEEFVECGGVSNREVDFKTMQSKVFPGIYFAGEILDIDGITGGFNFQNAWTTGWTAAQAMVLSFKTTN